MSSNESDSEERRRKEKNDEIRRETAVYVEKMLHQGKEKLDEKDFEGAVDILAEAVRAASIACVRYAPESYIYYLLYGRALLGLIAEQVEAKLDGSDKYDLLVLECKNDLCKHNLEDNIRDVLVVLGGAKEICKEQLEDAECKIVDDSEKEAIIQEWAMKMDESRYFLGHALILKGKSTSASTEFIKVIEIKEQSSTNEIVLITDFHDIAIALEEVLDFVSAKCYFERASALLKNGIKTTGMSQEDSDKLNAICESIQAEIDTIETEMLATDDKEQTVGVDESVKSASDMLIDDDSKALDTYFDAGFGDTQITSDKHRTSGLGDIQVTPSKHSTTGLIDTQSTPSKRRTPGLGNSAGFRRKKLKKR